MPQEPATGAATADPDPRGIRDRAGLATALLLLKARSKLSYRRLERVTADAPGARFGLPFTTIRDYLQGRSVPAPDRLDQILWACGVTDPDVLAEWGRALRRVLEAGGGVAAAPVGGPYPGPAAYDVGDAARFRGRERLTADLLGRVRALEGTGGLLAVVGVSGAGTTSLLCAGLVAALQRDEPGRSVRYGTPGGDPPGRLAELLAVDDGPGRPVVVLDQLEGLFAAPPPARTTFLSLLEQADAIVVLGLAEDLLARAAAEPLLAGALGGRELVVEPMTSDELRAAIVEPAVAAGRPVASGLVELLLHELRDAGAAHAPGALSLLNTALSATWAHGHGDELTIADYRGAGGVDGAAVRAAEAAFDTFDGEEQRVARALVLRTVRVDEAGERSRRPVTAEELAEWPALAEVARRLVAARVLTASAEGVSITHHAMLHTWARLSGWLDADRKGQQVRGTLIDAARRWRAGGRRDDKLLCGEPLKAAMDWAMDDELLPSEREYLRAGLDRQARRPVALRGRVRRLRLAVALLAALTTALVAVSAVDVVSGPEPVAGACVVPVQRPG